MRRRKILFAIVAWVAATIVSGGALLAIDVYLHARLQRYSALNVWGYRGPTVGRKRPGELRIAVLGGSAAFGYGIEWNQAIPAMLQRALETKRQAAGEGPVTVVNLAYNNEGAHSFKFTLQDYAYLDYDLVSLYSGYNDLILDPDANLSVYRHDSPVFRACGYMPILPVFLREKASSWVYGDIAVGYREVDGKRITAFRPGIVKAATAGAFRAAEAVASSLDRQFGRLAAESRPTAAIASQASPSSSSGPASGCPYPWANYCRGLFDAVDYTLARGKRVLVVTEPYLPGAARSLHVYQQRVMAEALERTYFANSRVKYVNLGAAVDLADPAVGYDKMHLTQGGSAIVARRLADPVMELARQ